MYSRATFYINGKEDSWVQSTIARPEKFVDAMAQSDTMIVGGPLFQEFGQKNRSTDNLVIGMDNNLRTGAFDGLINEVAIHKGDLAPDRIAQSLALGYCRNGAVTSMPITRPASAGWLTFHERTTTPAKTKVIFSIEDEHGQVLRRNVRDGTELSRIEAESIVLRAELSTSDPGQTPVLHSWSVSCEGETPPSVVSVSFPDQTATHSQGGSKAGNGVVL